MKRYTVQAYQHKDKKCCMIVADIIEKNTYYKTEIVLRGMNFAVTVGTYDSKDRAEKVLSDLAEIDIRGIIR